MIRTNEIRKDRDGAVKEFLRSALDAREALERQRERVEELESRCEQVTARPDGMPRGCGGRGPERLWAMLADEKAEEARLARREKQRREQVGRAIRRVADPAGQTVLRLRYLEGLRWPAVRQELERMGQGRSERGMYRLHSAALAEMGKAADRL